MNVGHKLGDLVLSTGLVLFLRVMGTFQSSPLEVTCDLEVRVPDVGSDSWFW